MPYSFQELEAEQSAINRAQVDRANSERLRAEADPATAASISALRAAYPWLTPGAALALAKAGITPEAPSAQAVAKAAGERKVNRGFGWNSIGDAIGKAASAGFTATKGVVRTGMTVLESGTQLVDAGVREVAHMVNTGAQEMSQGLRPGSPTANDDDRPSLIEQTNIGQVGKALITGESVDLGHGFLAGGDVVEAQRAAALASYNINGQAGTPGRILANMVTEPGTRPYNILSGMIDASVDIYGDPVNGALSATSKARKAAKSLVDVVDEPGRVARVAEAVGLVNGHRPAVITNRAEQWLTSGEGRRVVEYLAGEGDAFTISHRLGGKIDAPLAARLADAPTEADVLDVLRPELGITVRQKPTMTPGLLDAGGAFIRQHPAGVRLLSSMPGRHIDLDDVDDAVKALDDFLINAKMPEAARQEAFGRMARSTDRIERYRIVADAMDDVAAHVATKGKAGKGGAEATDASIAAGKRMTRMFRNNNAELARYFVDEVGNNVGPLGVAINGTVSAVPTPHLFTEYINRSLPLPDAREIRRATSSVGRLMEKVPGVEKSVALLDFLTQDVWKPMVLLRGAWTVRVVGEEQVRMAASGLNSTFRHPLSAIAWASATPQGKLSRFVSKAVEGAPVVGSRGAVDVLGVKFEDVADSLDDFAQAMSRRAGPLLQNDRGSRLVVAGKRLVARGDDAYAESWADELEKLHADPIAKRVAGGWAEGDKVPHGLTGNHADDAKRWFWDGPGKTFRKQLGESDGREALLTDRGIADQYIDSIAHRIAVKSAGHAELTDAVATGLLGDIPFRETGAYKLDQRFADALSRLTGPQQVVGDLTVRTGTKAGLGADKAVEAAFGFLMTRPTNFLSRSPAFRQFYWQRAEELLPKMTREAQEATLIAARDANLERATLRRMTKRMAVTGDLELADADVVAKGFGLDSTRELLYDLSDRHQLADIARHIAPFGEAWFEMLTRWSKIGYQNPQVIHRGQQVVQGARGAGFFHENERGEEVFTYPGSEFITEKLTGVPVPFEGAVTGLNLFSSNPLMPGLGPVVQVPASRIIPDRPEWDWVRDLVIPFGETSIEEKGGIIETFLPAWMQKWRQAYGAPADERLFANTVMDMARYLVSTGKYDTNTDQGQRTLEDTARSKAKTLYAIRSAAQFFAPTAPSPQFLVQDKNGNALVAAKVIERFHQLQEEDYDTAVDRFMAEFGDQAFLLMQPKSEGTGVTTKAALDWVRSNPELERAFPDVYRFFAPAGGDFDYNAYLRGFEKGTRKPITPDEALNRANNRVAAAIYSNAQDRAGAKPTAAQREWLAAVKDALVERYPGYGQQPVDFGKTDRLIGELAAAVKDPKLADTDTGKGVALYLAARDRANAAAVANSGGKVSGAAKAKAAKPQREWLRQVAAAITDKHPGFASVWEQLLSNELTTDDQE